MASLGWGFHCVYLLMEVSLLVAVFQGLVFFFNNLHV